MKKQLALIVFFATSIIFANTVSAADQEKKAVRNAAKQFYAALNQMFTGDLDLMKNVWSHKEDVTYMGPDGGFHHGWKHVIADWEKQAAMKLGGTVEPQEMRITVGPELAIVSNYEIGKNKGPEGQIRNVKIRATSLFRKENGKWKMIGHHTDLLPFLMKKPRS
ncbi:YybH family protein [Gimesia aquarii]|uniref:SnoaL-like domain protein n=1 Tax=Gimesia aquarii TaxID=2527964 RepID=A0A517VRN3_9PLAN|nr:nuclear transport factor 2 family protein [Gimesia aquarii]QDT95694.1 SnoaL-like domain protein [Gimesia aquarii]